VQTAKQFLDEWLTALDMQYLPLLLGHGPCEPIKRPIPKELEFPPPIRIKIAEDEPDEMADAQWTKERHSTAISCDGEMSCRVTPAGGAPIKIESDWPIEDGSTHQFLSCEGVYVISDTEFLHGIVNNDRSREKAEAVLRRCATLKLQPQL